MVARAGYGHRRSVFNSYIVLVWTDEKVQQMEGGDGYTTVRMYFLPLSSSNTVKMVNFMLFVCSYNKNVCTKLKETTVRGFHNQEKKTALL